MDVFTAMKGRQSVRKFRKDPVPREKLLRMVEAATWAPSAGNVQNVRFLVVGAYAVSFHAEPRATGDLDIWVCGWEGTRMVKL